MFELDENEVIKVLTRNAINLVIENNNVNMNDVWRETNEQL